VLAICWREGLHPRTAIPPSPPPLCAGVADFSSADLARVLWGYAAAGQQGGPLVASATKALAGAADISAKELGQVGVEVAMSVWASATLTMALDASSSSCGRNIIATCMYPVVERLHQRGA
jgi:hypothetical protein